MKRFFLIIAVLVLSYNFSISQYDKGKVWVGPTLGYGFGNLGYGATGEYGITDNIGLGVDVGYTGFKEDFGGLFMGTDTYFEYTLLGVLVAGSYHFLPKDDFDPYIKAGVGYLNWDAKFFQNGKEITMPFGTSAAYTSGVGFTGQIGMRYHFSDMMSVRASLGYPFIFGAGLDFAF